MFEQYLSLIQGQTIFGPFMLVWRESKQHYADSKKIEYVMRNDGIN